MNKTQRRGIAANQQHRTLADLIHAHPAIASIALILAIGILPAIVEWLAA